MLTPRPWKRAFFFLFFDIALSFITLYLAYDLRFNFNIADRYLENFLFVFATLISLKIVMMYLFRIYTISWKFVSLEDGRKLLYAHLLAYFTFTAIYYFSPSWFIPFPRSVIIIDLVLSVLTLGILRLSKRLFFEKKESDEKSLNTLLLGVSAFSQTLLKNQEGFRVVSIVDDNNMLINSYIGNIKVLSYHEIEKIVKEKNISAVIITKELERDFLNELHSKLHTLGIFDIKVVSLIEQNLELKPISVEDLLLRKPQGLDKEVIANFIEEKVVLITGAGGSIGSELSRQVQVFGAKQIILVDNSEFNLYAINEELDADCIVAVMQNVKERELLEKTFSRYKPDIVIHAAAYKHVPLCEENIQEAINNNVLGTKNVIDLSIKYEVSKVVLISTDKAVRPTNVMGTTKRICELYAHAIPSHKTEIAAVRFGNVLGSSGSVIPKFKTQIEKGEAITVTHPEITRYFMMIPEACQLVLQAASIAKGRELFILDMGEPIKIVDLANKMIELSGRDDIDIVFSGLRPGEKLYEELLIDDADLKTEYSSIMVSQNPPVDYAKLLTKIEKLQGTDKELLSVLKEIVPEFNHQLN